MSKRPTLLGRSGEPERLRVAFVAGTLGPGGAEKQLVYWIRALRTAGVSARVYSITQGEVNERTLRNLGVVPLWIGRNGSPVARLGRLAWLLRDFRPHIVQAAHFFTNLYAALVAPFYGAVSIGAIRNDAEMEMKANGRWGRWLLHAPRLIIANSERGRDNAASLGRAAKDIRIVPNVIDLADFDAAAGKPHGTRRAGGLVIMTVARLYPEKRLDRLLETIALVRAWLPDVRLQVVGSGPEAERLETLARQLALCQGAVEFLGYRDDVPKLLRLADALVLTSDHEGFPNVLLEAMAARLPVVTTAVGDARTIVEHGKTGYVVPRAEPPLLANAILRLARDPRHRSKMGELGRRRVATLYGFERLADHLLNCYRGITEPQTPDRRATIPDSGHWGCAHDTKWAESKNKA